MLINKIESKEYHLPRLRSNIERIIKQEKIHFVRVIPQNDLLTYLWGYKGRTLVNIYVWHRSRRNSL